MKLRAFMFVLLMATVARSAPTRELVGARLVKWSRGSVEVMTQSLPGEEHESLCIITPKKLTEGRAALVIWFRGHQISSVASGPALEGCEFSIDDLERIGTPDVIQIIDAKSHALIEAYSIIDGIVEPLPDAQFSDTRHPFSPGDPVVDYLRAKRKVKEPNQSSQPTRPAGG